MAEFKNFDSSVLEGHVKFREKKAWKRRWCVVRRLSPVANSLTMQFYKKSSSKSKGAVSKASLNLEHLLGLESCFLLQKESQTLAIICRTLVAVLAFENREMLLEWQAQITEILGHSEKYEVQLLSVPGKLEITSGSAVLHIRDWQFSLTQGTPPRLIGYWNMADLRRFGAVDDRRFCFEGGSRCSSRGFEGVFVLGSSRSQEISSKFEFAVRGRLCEFQRARIHPSSTLNGLLTPMTRHRVNSRCNVGNAQSMSKPNTPLLGSQRRAQEFCLSPPCARHTRSYSQQHSRTSSISSGTRLSSALQRSDPELLYDKPRSLNAAQAVYEVCGGGGGGGGTVEPRPPADATLPANHYDTPRRILQNLSVQNGQSNGNVLQVPNGISSLYATVTKTKKSKKTAADPAQEVQGYLVVERGGGGGAGGVGGVTGMGSSQQQTDYVQMQSLPCSPATLLQRQARCLATVDQCRRSCCGDRVYQNSNVAYRCLYNKSCYAHCTLPLLHPKSTHQTESQSAASGIDVPLRLRRSASMPASACRQVGNRDSSDSTDSGVSVTADASAHYASMMNGAGHHHHRTRNGGCVHHQLYLPRHWSLPRPHANHQSVALWSDASPASSSGVNHLTAAAAQSTVNQSAHSQSNSSSLSNILDRLETLSVASVGYETCV